MFTTRLSSIFFLLFAVLAIAGTVGAAPRAAGLIVKASPYDVATTVERFENIARNNGLRIFDTIDHARGARAAGLNLAPTMLVMFGNPKAGTPLMHCGRTIAIDLPSKALAWRDASGQTWFAYNDIDALARRHHIVGCKAIPQVRAMLDRLAEQTITPDNDPAGS